MVQYQRYYNNTAPTRYIRGTTSQHSITFKENQFDILVLHWMAYQIISW
jgi:hypothetical protein